MISKKNYQIKLIKKGVILIDGTGKSAVWKKANLLKDFTSPWTNDKLDKIEFKALWDTEKFYFKFKVFDSQLHINPDNRNYNGVNNSDRVELFFRTSKSLNPYYCLEIDPTPRIMDFKAKPNKQFDFDWNWPSEDIVVKSSIEKLYFVVEGAITIKSLIDLGLIKNGIIEAGIYRAKYKETKMGDVEPVWVSWVNPETKTPNFHTSTSFGVFTLL